MAGTLRISGFLMVAGLVVVYILNSFSPIASLAHLLTNSNFTMIATLGGLMIAAGFLLPIVSGAAGAVAGKRCPRCAKRVEKNQLYCLDHQKKALEELRDRDKTGEDTNFKRRRKP